MLRYVPGRQSNMGKQDVKPGPAVVQRSKQRGAVNGPRCVGVGSRLARLTNPVALGRSVLARFAKHARALFCRSWVNRVKARLGSRSGELHQSQPRRGKRGGTDGQRSRLLGTRAVQKGNCEDAILLYSQALGLWTVRTTWCCSVTVRTVIEQPPTCWSMGSKMHSSMLKIASILRPSLPEAAVARRPR